MHTPELEIPHPRYRERRFVLEPLAELNPALKDPQTGQTVQTMLQAVSEKGLTLSRAGLRP
jgi:7,8-dihydro-6-hydroxymethylpterin-pyrophosphokinase